MSKIRSMVIRSKDQSDLERLNHEYHHYCGRETKLTRGVLVVFAKPQGNHGSHSKVREYKGATR